MPNPSTRSDSPHPLDGVRAVALIEAAKGALILLTGFGLLSLLHKNVQEVAEELVGHLHLNPASRIPRIFLELAGDLTSSRLWLLAGFAITYSGLRFLEAYGLWHERRWAEWLAVASGAIYVPFEIYELFAGITAIRLITFTVNAVIVAYMGYVLWHSREGSGNAPNPDSGGRR
jgi:uncharacterized membrane protein (DUF2068 family)